MEKINIRVTGIADAVESALDVEDVYDILKFINDDSDQIDADIIDTVIRAIQRKSRYRTWLQDHTEFRMTFASVCTKSERLRKWRMENGKWRKK